MSSSPALEEDTYQEIRNFQKSLIRSYIFLRLNLSSDDRAFLLVCSCLDAQHMGVIFVECMTRSVSAEKAMIGGGNHLVIDCFGLPLDRFNEAKVHTNSSYCFAILRNLLLCLGLFQKSVTRHGRRLDPSQKGRSCCQSS